jgi:hypothetical protein
MPEMSNSMQRLLQDIRNNRGVFELLMNTPEIFFSSGYDAFLKERLTEEEYEFIREAGGSGLYKDAGELEEALKRHLNE